MATPNAPLIAALQEIAQLYTQENDKYRARTFSRAAEQLQKLDYPLRQIQDLPTLPGIGPSLRSDIDSFLRNGSIPRLENLRNQASAAGDERQVLDMFEKMTGVGPVTARQFYQAGYRRIEDLKPEELTDTQRLGFRFYYHLLERIPRAEITQFQEFLTCLFSNLSLPFEWEIVGSYRRQEESSGDIDILVKDLGPGTLRRFMAPLLTPGENGPLIPGTLSFGEKKFMGILQLTPQHVARRLDVTVVNPDTFPFALLHATGSKQFNQVIRSYALSLGWSLSEYSLTSTATGERYQGPIHSEEDIFRVLGLAFVPPVKRVRNFSELWLAP